VNLDDAHHHFKSVGQLEQGVDVYTKVVYSVMLKCEIQVVMLRTIQGQEIRQALLYSTDVELDAMTLVNYYRSRF